jgi:hypothetical protein
MIRDSSGRREGLVEIEGSRSALVPGWLGLRALNRAIVLAVRAQRMPVVGVAGSVPAEARKCGNRQSPSFSALSWLIALRISLSTSW